MAKYCLDTSGLSNPAMEMPETIYVSLWAQVTSLIHDEIFCWNVEIAEELSSIYGAAGQALMACNGSCCLEVGVGDWPWPEYIELVNEWSNKYNAYISEYNGGRKNTIGLNDLSIVALAKTLGLPVVSMERQNFGPPSTTKLRIPDLCLIEGVKHYSFNEFLQNEGVKV